jgi:sugar phosphate permease
VLTLPALPASFGYGSLLLGTAAAIGYWFHFRRTEYPLLDLTLFRLPLFRITAIAGTFFRLGTGAMPFLFPLMLQLAFGLSPFESGSITFASAVGAFAAKFVAEWTIEKLGFRALLVISTFVTVLGVVAMGLYSPDTPLYVMIPLLITTGFFQSLFWTATNAFTFADVPDKDAGQANVLSQVGIQLSLAFGVALGGGVLEAVRLSHGGEPVLLDFHIAFYVIAAVTLVSTILFFRMPKTATMIHHSASESPAE